MGRVWILDTETKGTGAEMVPLDKVQQRKAEAKPFYVPPKPKRRAPAPPPPRAPRRFRIVDVTTREVLADDASARDTLAALSGVRSIVDVNVSVWEPDEDRWRLLSLAEQRMLWERRNVATGSSGRR